MHYRLLQRLIFQYLIRIQLEMQLQRRKLRYSVQLQPRLRSGYTAERLSAKQYSYKATRLKMTVRRGRSNGVLMSLITAVIITPTSQVMGSWYRIYVGTIFASWFGVVGSGDVTSALLNFATFVTTQGLEGELSAGTFNISSSILLANHLNGASGQSLTGASGWAIRGSSVCSTILNMTAASGSHLQVTGYNISGWVIEKINFTASSALTSGAAIYFSDSTLAVRMTAYNADDTELFF